MGTPCMYAFFIEEKWNSIAYVEQFSDGYPYGYSQKKNEGGGVLEWLHEFLDQEMNKVEDCAFGNHFQLAANYVSWLKNKGWEAILSNSAPNDAAYLYKIKLILPPVKSSEIGNNGIQLVEKSKERIRPTVTFEEFRFNRYYHLEMKVNPTGFLYMRPPMVDVEHAYNLLQEGYSIESIKLKILAERIEWSDVTDKEDYIDYVIKKASKLLNTPKAERGIYQSLDRGSERIDILKQAHAFQEIFYTELKEELYPMKLCIHGAYAVEGFKPDDLKLSVPKKSNFVKKLEKLRK